MAKKVRVRLLVPRTDVGAIGDVVEYDADVATDHVARGLCELADDEAGSESKAEQPRRGRGASET